MSELHDPQTTISDFTMHNTSTIQLKLVLLGNESVGKTSLLSKWSKNAFDPESRPTIGGSTELRHETYDGQQYCFQIWDTAGAERVFLFSYTSIAL